MSKKNLLQESDIRRMMKFANIGALSDPFVEKLNEAGYYGEEEDEGLHPDEGLHGEMAHAEEGHMGMMEQEDDMPDDMPDDEPEMDMDDDDEELDLDMDDDEGDMDDAGGVVEKGLEGLNAFLQAAMERPEEIKSKVSVEMADAPDDAPAMDAPPMDEPPGMDMGDDAPGMDMGADDAAPPMPDDEEEPSPMEEDLFNEVVRRVARRLLNK